MGLERHGVAQREQAWELKLRNEAAANVNSRKFWTRCYVLATSSDSNHRKDTHEFGVPGYNEPEDNPDITTMTRQEIVV